MQLRDQFIRHQVFLARLVNTQARETKKALLDTEKYILDNISHINYAVIEAKLQNLLNLAMPLLYELARYESEFTAKKIKRKPLSALKTNNIVDTIKVPTTLNKSALSIQDNYTSFIKTKSKQYIQIIQDAKVMSDSEDVISTKIREITKGLFTVQNKALAQISVIAVANQVRKETVFHAN